MLKDSKPTIVEKFQTKFGGLLRNFYICPKDLTISSIDNQSIDSPLNCSEELLKIKSTKKKRKDFKGISAYSNKTKKVTIKSEKLNLILDKTFKINILNFIFGIKWT